MYKWHWFICCGHVCVCVCSVLCHDSYLYQCLDRQPFSVFCLFYPPNQTILGFRCPSPVVATCREAKARPRLVVPMFPYTHKDNDGVFVCTSSSSERLHDQASNEGGDLGCQVGYIAVFFQMMWLSRPMSAWAHKSTRSRNGLPKGAGAYTRKERVPCWWKMYCFQCHRYQLDVLVTMQ